MISSLIEGIIDFFFRLFIEIVCFYTGEMILSLLTFGKRKPKWHYYAEASPTKFVILTEISVWIGIAFWLFTFGFIARTLLE